MALLHEVRPAFIFICSVFLALTLPTPPARYISFSCLLFAAQSLRTILTRLPVSPPFQARMATGRGSGLDDSICEDDI